MNEYASYMDEKEYKIIRIFMLMAGLEDIAYEDLDNMTLYTILQTLSIAAEKPRAKRIMQKELDKMERWYKDMLFFDALEEALLSDDQEDSLDV